MAKAITEIGLGAAAIGAAILIPGGGIAIGTMMISHAAAAGALASMGGSLVLSGLGDALRKNQGGLAVAVTTPIGPWGYIYGRQKVGGVEIFRESNNSQGTSNDKQLHRVYVLACHPCSLGSFELRIDGKPVPLVPGTYPNSWHSVSPTQQSASISSISRADGVVTMHLSSPIAGQDGLAMQMLGIGDNTFNGTFTVTQPNPADPTTLTYVCGGPDATTGGGSARTTYPDYQDKIYVETCDGHHTSTFAGMLESGTTWKATDLCLGRTLFYVRMGYDQKVFPSSIPNVSFVLDGKDDILDPRTNTRGFTRNAALCIADYLSLSPTKGGFGLVIGTDIPTAQLIAAANICDEAVPLAAGGTISRYTCDTFFQLTSGRGTILKDMLTSCAGRITYQGGQYSIAPGAWVAPTLQLTDADIIGKIDTHPRLSIRDTCNAVKGTYVSPENAYQQADVPAYMQDAKHGFVSDIWLAEDKGERIFREANFPCTNNSATAQRLAKIGLLRTRYQMRVTLQCKLSAYQCVALDVIQLSHPRYGWVNKNFEVLSSRFMFDRSGQIPRPYIELELAETDPSIYDWPPENVTAYSGPGATIDGVVYPSTITTRSDGTVQNSIYVRWKQPNDANVVRGGHLEIQWQVAGASDWTALANITPTTSSVFITGVSDGSQYDIQVRAVNCANVPSDWIPIGPVTVSLTANSITTTTRSIAPVGTLVSQAFSDGTAQIVVRGFTPQLVGAAACTPSPNTLSGLSQARLYYVYYVDPTLAGGTITPIATQNPADFENQAGALLIGSIVTPSYSARYQPSNFADIGSQSTISPAAAYDNSGGTAAVVSAYWQTWNRTGLPYFPDDINAAGNCLFNGFPAVTITSGKTLKCSMRLVNNGNGPTWSATATVWIGSTPSTLATFTSAGGPTDFTFAIPSGTDLSTVSVEAFVEVDQGPEPGSPGQANDGTIELSIYDIAIQ
jgi:hypothetical protein